MGLPVGAAEAHHSASKWRYEVARVVQDLMADSDAEVWRWLRDGAPMGIACPIQPGGWFPAALQPSELEVDELHAECRWRENHPSFDEVPEGFDEPPGHKLVADYVARGFGHLFASQEEASRYFGVEIHPAPMGTVTTLKPDGSRKDRCIQDLRANSVNRAVTLPERQVLPRPLDHAKDLAKLSQACGQGEVVLTMILDFADAFMGIPLAQEERPFNATVLAKPVNRGRPPEYEGEPEAGSCVVWAVLGFGGRPNPLIFGRAASFAMRAGQALLGRPRRDVCALRGLGRAREQARGPGVRGRAAHARGGPQAACARRQCPPPTRGHRRPRHGS